MISASSAPIQANEDVAGFWKTLYIWLRGPKRKVFPQFAGPVRRIFLYFPRPRSRRSITARLNIFSSMWFRSSISFAIVCQLPSHLQSSSNAALNTVMRSMVDRCNVDGARSISQHVSMRLSISFWPVWKWRKKTHNVNKCVCLKTQLFIENSSA